MDEETRAALELTREELRAMRDAAEPGVVAKRPRDLNRLAAAIVKDATEPPGEGAWLVVVPSGDELSVTIDGLTVEPGFKEQDRFLSVDERGVKVT